MITQLRLRNFKAVYRETSLQLAPLTVFCGVNSGGKSTIIQLILLVSQTLASKVASRSVVLNGPLTKLGQFADLKPINGTDPDITIGWECRPLDHHDPLGAIARLQDIGVFFEGDMPGEPLTKLKCAVTFAADPNAADHEFQQIQPQLLSVKLEVESGDSASGSSFLAHRVKSEVELRTRASELGIVESPINPGLLYSVELDQRSRDEIAEEALSAVPIGATMRHFLPQRLVVRVNAQEERANAVIGELLDGRRNRWSRAASNEALPIAIVELLKTLPPNIRERLFDEQPSLISSPESPASLYSLDHFRARRTQLSNQTRLSLRHALLTLEGKMREALTIEFPVAFTTMPVRLPRGLIAATSYLDNYFSAGVRYLGPLRDDPRALYPMTTSLDPSDVGIRGENTAAVFELHKRRLVGTISSKGFAKSEIDASPEKVPLSDAVLDWLNYLGIASSIETKDRGKLGHELRVISSDDKFEHDLTHVGVGVSQVLPILVACLLADPDTLLIVEQPELHLHPRVQTLLGDFFLAMSLLGKQCLLETHSEYLVNRLRFRIAASIDDSLVESTRIYFAEKHRGAADYREIEVNEFGAIQSWPTGFFDESQREAEALIKAAMEKRARRKASK